MKVFLTDEQTHQTRFIADNCFYMVPQQKYSVLCSTFHEAIEYIPRKDRVLDPVALLSLLSFGYVCGDRTMVRGLKRIPLHSVINSKGEIVREPQLPHSYERAPIREIAENLLDLITDEIDGVVRNESEVVILLSGGLDSRVTAGVLRHLQNQYRFSVRAVTWGSMQSRDWVFSHRICEIYEWEHINIPLGPQTLWSNIMHSVDLVGAEVSGEHFHAMKELDRYLPKNVVILASSYGDGIGRAAYSGTRVEELYFRKPHKLGSLFYQARFLSSREDLINDIRAPWSRGNVRTQKQAYEIASIENYWRRMLNPLMYSLDDDFRLYQVFTAEPVVRYMWSFDTSLRDDRVYQTLIPMLDYELARIPWQKTNQALVKDAWSPSTDSTRDFHNYSGWIHTELREQFEAFLLGDPLNALLHINPIHVQFYWEQFQKMDASHPFFKSLSRRFARLVGVLRLMEDYQIVCDDAAFERTLYDRTYFPLQAHWQLGKLRHHIDRNLRRAPYVGKNIYQRARRSELAKAIWANPGL